MSESKASGSGKRAASGSLKQMRMRNVMSKERDDSTNGEENNSAPENVPQGAEIQGAEIPAQTHETPDAPRTTVRVTVDVGSAQHKFLKHFAVEAGSTSTRVVRGLLDLLEQDDNLRERLLRDLH